MASNYTMFIVNHWTDLKVVRGGEHGSLIILLPFLKINLTISVNQQLLNNVDLSTWNL
jgi:hypothetical protein